jgi:glucuronate isomerase
VKAAPGEHEDLRLAAKVADREKAADAQWPAFERRLRELGYDPHAVLRAFEVLKGPGTVDEALDELKRHGR